MNLKRYANGIIQCCNERIRHQNQIRYFPGINEWLNMMKSINSLHFIARQLAVCQSRNAAFSYSPKEMRHGQRFVLKIV